MSVNDPIPQLDGLKSAFGRDLYFFLMKISWPRLYLIIFTSYIFINIVFSVIYALIPNAITDSSNMLNYFFFSIQSFSTIGYGNLAPVNPITNFVVMLQSILGIIYTASITGMFFSKLSKPHSKIRFSKNLLVTYYNGKKQLIFRIGNTRGNDIVEAKIRVSVLHKARTEEGENLRQIVDIPIIRSTTPFFRLTWTIRHNLDENSFFNETENYLNFERIIITIVGHDSIFSNTIHDRHVYLPKDILFNRRFKDIIEEKDIGVKIDYLNFDSTVEIGK
tara:strand:- start:17966 stop:18796 length:831 start_codon:yes stop_codon:yes gene_type:complete